MAAIYRSDGAQLEMITPVGGVTQGQIVAIGDIIGIAAETAAAGTGMTLLRSGVFTVPNGEDAAFSAGDAVYFSAETGKTSTQIGSLPLLGYAVSDVVEGNSTAVVLLAYAQPATGSTPVAAYTEISFTWYQVGTSDPVIVSENQLPGGTTIVPAQEDTGLFTFTFSPDPFPDHEKCEVLGGGVITPAAYGTPVLVSQLLGAGAPILYAFVTDTSGVATNGVGSLAKESYVTSVIRIFP